MQYDELVKQLRDNAEFLVKASSGHLANSFSETMNQAAEAIEELEGKNFIMKKTAEWLAEKVPRWIPVTERLPGSGVPTLICGDGNVVEQGFFDDEYGYWYDWGGNRTFVHHWMPLPEPPKEET